MTSPIARERSIGEKLLIAVLILAVGDVTAKALGLAISIVRTRTLTTAEFGGLGFIVSTIGMFAQVAGFSLGLAATHYIARYRTSEPSKAQEIAQFILVFGMVTTSLGSVLMIVLAPFLVSNTPGLLGPLQFSVLVLITQTVSGLMLGMLIGLERFRVATLATILQNIVMLILTLWWAPVFGLMGTIAAMAIGFSTTLAAALWGTRDLIFARPFNLVQLWSHKSILWKFCLPLLLSGFILLPASWLSLAIIAGQHGSDWELLSGLFVLPPSWLSGLGVTYHYASGLREIAIFYAADQLRPILSLLTNVVSQPMMPIISSQVRQANDVLATEKARQQAREKAQNATMRSFQLVICLVLPAHAILAFAGPYIMAIFGKAFATEWNVYLVVLAFAAISGITGLIGTSMQAQGRVWLANILMAMFGILLITFSYFLRGYGALGLAFAYLLTAFVSFLVTAFVLYQNGVLSFQANMLILGSMFWLTIISFCAAYVIDTWRLAAIPLAFVLTLVVLFLVMRAPMQHVWRLAMRKATSFTKRN